MGETVELRAHLADLAYDQLLVAAPAVRLRVHEGAFGVHVEAPRAEDRHRRVEHVAELNHLAGPDQSRRPQHGLRLHVVGGTSLVAGPPFGGTALIVGGRLPRLGTGRNPCEAERRCDGGARYGFGNGLHAGSSLCADHSRLHSYTLFLRTSFSNRRSASGMAGRHVLDEACFTRSKPRHQVTIGRVELIPWH